MGKFEEIFGKIRKILSENDPIGLITEGAPEDEYDQLILNLIGALNKVSDSKLRAKIIEEKINAYWSIKEQSFPEKKVSVINKILKEWPEGFTVSDK